MSSLSKVLVKCVGGSCHLKMNPVGCFQNRGKKKDLKLERCGRRVGEGSKDEFDQNTLYEYTKFLKSK